MHRLIIKTHKKREIVDITEQLEQVLWKQHPEKTGICQLNLLHTTAALATADLDPGTDLDMLDAFEQHSPTPTGIRTTQCMCPTTSCQP